MFSQVYFQNDMRQHQVVFPTPIHILSPVQFSFSQHTLMPNVTNVLPLPTTTHDIHRNYNSQAQLPIVTAFDNNINNGTYIPSRTYTSPPKHNQSDFTAANHRNILDSQIHTIPELRANRARTKSKSFQRSREHSNLVKISSKNHTFKLSLFNAHSVQNQRKRINIKDFIIDEHIDIMFVTV